MSQVILNGVSALRDIVVKVYQRVQDTSLSIVAVVAMVVVFAIIAVRSPNPGGRPEAVDGNMGTTSGVAHGTGRPLVVVPPPEGGEVPPKLGNTKTGAAIDILGAKLLDDGELEVRGEVTMAERSDEATTQDQLRSLQVRVLVDGAKGEGLIDTERNTWQVSFRPRRRPKAGDWLELEAILYGEQGNRELHRIRRPILVQRLGSP